MTNPSVLLVGSDLHFIARESCFGKMIGQRISRKIFQDFKENGAIIGAALWLVLISACKSPTESGAGPRVSARIRGTGGGAAGPGVSPDDDRFPDGLGRNAG